MGQKMNEKALIYREKLKGNVTYESLLLKFINFKEREKSIRRIFLILITFFVIALTHYDVTLLQSIIILIVMYFSYIILSLGKLISFEGLDELNLLEDITNLKSRTILNVCSIDYIIRKTEDDET